jgi:hypothetical protein
VSLSFWFPTPRRKKKKQYINFRETSRRRESLALNMKIVCSFKASRTTPPTKRHIPADLSPRQMMQDVHVKLRVNPRLPSQNTFNRKKKLATCYIWRTALYGAETCDNSESRSEIPGKSGNVVLKQDGDHLDRWFENLKKYYNSQRRKEHPAYNKKGRKLTGLVTSCVGTAF